MKILKRKVAVLKPKHEILAILKSCAYYIPKAVFNESTFSMHFPKRHDGKGPYLMQVKGEIQENANGAVVRLEIHANLQFFLGCLLAGFGACWLLYCLWTCTNSWISCLGIILVGLLFIGQSLGTGSEILDQIEHKLTYDQH